MRTLALLAISALAIATLATSAGAAPTQSVTLQVIRAFDQPTRSFKLRFSGVVSSGAAGEDVTVMQQVCGYSFATAVAGAQTRSGGAWGAEPANQSVIATSATYRARWGNARSEPVAIRPQVAVFLVPVGKGRLLFRASIGSVYQDLRGRVVLLERLREKRWTVIQRRKLTFDPAGFAGSYVTTFVTPRGWSVRARMPAKSAAPCFRANSTDKVVAG